MTNLDKEFRLCQCCYPTLESATLPDPRRALPVRRIWWRLKRYSWYARVLGPVGFVRRMLYETPEKRAASTPSQDSATSNGVFSPEPGELVEVRSEKEIFATLDSDGKLKGLRFTPEMSKYCGKRFPLYKRVKKIIVEATGENRAMRSPTFILENVICDGSAHGECDRACFAFWRPEWLKRVTNGERS